MRVKDIWIDGDHMIYIATHEVKALETELDGEALEDDNRTKRQKSRDHKNRIKNMIQHYIDTVEVESILYNWSVGETHVVFTDSEGNFRNKLSDDYKAKRPESSEENKALKKWCVKNYILHEGLEADDVVAYHVRKGAVGVTADKDLLKGVSGKWYDTYHKIWVRTTKEEAIHFTNLQTLMGDLGDGIPGIFGVGKVKAEKMLIEFGSDWKGIVRAYESKGLTEKDAILTRRLIGMDQYDGEKLNLFKGDKDVSN